MSIISKAGGSAPKTTTSATGGGIFGAVGRFFGAVGRTAGRIFSDVGKVAGPLLHDVATVLADPIIGSADPRKRPKTVLLEPLAKEIQRRGANLPTDLGTLVSNPKKALHTISGSLPGLFIPGVATLDQLTTKAGRREIGNHPGFAILDVLPVVGKVKAPIKGVLNVAGDAALATKTGTRIGAITAPARSKVSLTAAKKAAVLHSIGREVHETVRSSLEEILPRMKKLTDDDYTQLNELRIRGERPPANHPLRDLYDDVERHQLARGEAGTARTPPEGFLAMLKVKSLHHRPAKSAQTYAERLIDGLTDMEVGGQRISVDGAEHVMRYMTQAFLDDAPNPFAHIPQLSKTWTRVNNHYKSLVRQTEQSYGKLYREPVTGGYYSAPEMRAVRRATYGEGTRGGFTDIQRLAASETDVARTLKWYVDNGGVPDTNAYLSWLQSSLRTNHPSWNAQQIADEIARHGDVISRGMASDSTRAYINAVRQMPPGNYQAYLDEAKRQIRTVKNRQLVVPGFGPRTAERAVDDILNSANGNIMELVAQGRRPVWTSRRALTAEGADPGALLPTRPGVPGSMKSSQGLAPAYMDDMGFMMIADEAADALQHTALKTLSQLWIDTGSPYWSQVIDDLTARGFSKGEAISLAKKRYDSFELGVDGRPVISEAREGAILMPKEYAIHVRHLFDPPQHAMVADKFLKWWMIPTLALAPMFHVNNAVGGAILTAMRTPVKNPVALTKAFRDAFQAAKKGQILDPRIPTGRGLMPMFKDFMSVKDVDIAANLYGRGLKEAVEHWYGGPVKGANWVLDISEKANKFLDEMYRNFVAIASSPEYATTGRISDDGIRAAGRLMQDYDSMIPFEREVIQRLIPFWSWKRTLIRWATTYPMDHPIRTTVLNQMARWNEEQSEASEWLDEFLMNNLAITKPDAKGFQMFMTIRGMNPFSDFSNMATLKGWLSSTHPLLQAALKTVGYDPFLGGVRAHARKEETTVDRNTGAAIRKLSPEGITEIIPQLRALQQLVGAPPPGEDSMEGWFRWWKKYGASLRLLPSLVYLNLDEEERRHREIEGLEPLE